MRIILVADVFPPLRISGAVQLRDLALEFVRQGIESTVLTPEPALESDYEIENWRGVRVIRVKAGAFRDLSYIRRTIGEFLMPFVMLKHFRKSPLANERWDGVVWYSPSIFLGPLAAALKSKSKARSYLIVRDIFPEWAVDLGLIGRGGPYYFFKSIERYLYSVANVIGVQTPANLPYFERWARSAGRRTEVLHNWLAVAPDIGCSIKVESTSLAGRRICLYAGNMGVAQGMEHMIELVAALHERKDIGFLFVGRGGNAKALRQECERRGLDNILFFDEIDPDEIPGLCAQCDVGLVALDPRHKTHNVPGKFLAYMSSGLPVLANLNPGNDLADLIEQEGVGLACADGSRGTLLANALRLLEQVRADSSMPARCRALAEKLYSPRTAVEQIIGALRR